MIIPLLVTALGIYALSSDDEAQGMNAPRLSKSDKLKKIHQKYKELDYNTDNYDVGGGLSDNKFASNRHEDARCDIGKLTLGEATQLFKKASGLETKEVKGIIEFNFPNMEWHHAGRLPKRYGGGMKKTYFLNSKEVSQLAKKWNEFEKKYFEEVARRKKEADEWNKKQQLKSKFLKKYAEYVSRVITQPKWFYKTQQEMNGKYGWFDSSDHDYNLTEYYSGWKFRSKRKYDEFRQKFM